VEDLQFIAQATGWIGFILNDFWSFCAMRTFGFASGVHKVPKADQAANERRSSLPRELRPIFCVVSIANESDQVTKEHLVDALAVRGEEGRGTLR
jgi:hypothetical protein